MNKAIIFADGFVSSTFVTFLRFSISEGNFIVFVDLAKPTKQIEYALSEFGYSKDQYIILEPIILHEQ